MGVMVQGRHKTQQHFVDTRSERLPGPALMEGAIKPLAPPEAPEPKPIPLIKAILPIVMLVAVVGMVVVMVSSGIARSPMTFLFPIMMVVSTLGMLASSASAGTDMGALRRDYQRHLSLIRQAISDAMQAQREHAYYQHPNPNSLVHLSSDLRWGERQADDDDFLVVRIGTGVVSPSTPVQTPEVGAPEKLDPVSAVALRDVIRAASAVSEVPISVNLAQFSLVWLGSVAPDRRLREPLGLARAICAELIALHHPNEVRIAVIDTGDDGDPDWTSLWDGVKWAPHSDGIGDLQWLQQRVLDEPEVHFVALYRATLGRLPTQLVGELQSGMDGLPNLTVIAIGGDETCAAAEQASWEGLALQIHQQELIALTGAGEEHIGRADCLVATQLEVLARKSSRFFTEQAAVAAQETFDPVLRALALDRAQERRELPPRLGKQRLRVPIGLNDDGRPVYLDFKESAEGGFGPHGLCIGATGSGKSEFLKSTCLALAATHSPDQLNFILVDFKGGATFLGLEELPHVSAVITNLADELILVDRMQDAIYGEMTRRQEILRKAGKFPGVAEYEAARRNGRDDLKPFPALMIVVDEFSELLGQRPEFAELFVAVGRLGRSLHMHLLLASQRLDEGKLRGLDSHLSYRIGLKTFSAVESRTVLGIPDAYLLPAIPGMGYLKTDSDAPERFRATYVSGQLPQLPQMPQMPPDKATDDETLDNSSLEPVPEPPAVSAFSLGDVAAWAQRKDAAAAANDANDANAANAAQPASKKTESRPVEKQSVLEAAVHSMLHIQTKAHQVWLPPLPHKVALEKLVQVQTAESTAIGRAPLTATIGIIDKPAAQRQDPWHLDFRNAGGHAAIVGAPRSGKTSALRTIIAAVAATSSSRQVNFHIIDFAASGLHDLEILPHVSSVTYRGDDERLRRVIQIVAAEVTRRERVFRQKHWASVEEARAGGLADIFLVLDGYPVFRNDHPQLAEQVQAVVADGLAVGIHVIVTAHRWSEIRPAVRDLVGTKVELRQAEPMDSMIDRKSAKLVPDRPGRGLVSIQSADASAETAIMLPQASSATAVTVRTGLAGLVAWTSADTLQQIARRCEQRGDKQAEGIELLPRLVTAEMVAGYAGKAADEDATLWLGLEESQLAAVPWRREVDHHLLVFGAAGSGRTNAVEHFGTEFLKLHPKAKAIVLDYRRGLLEAFDPKRLAGYAGSSSVATPMMSELAKLLASRLPGPDISVQQLKARNWWSGPEILLVVDDYDLVANSRGNPLGQLADFIPHARDIGLTVVIARRISGAIRSLHDPVVGAVKDQGSSVLILEGSKEDGPIMGVSPSTQPPGRGFLVRHGKAPTLIQTIKTVEHDDAAEAHAAIAEIQADAPET